MIAILTVLVALPVGYLIRNRVVGFLVFGLTMAHLYTFQSLSLVVEWVEGDDSAFGSAGSSATLPYLLVTTVVYAVGLGLVALGQRLRVRRDARRGAVQLESA